MNFSCQIDSRREIPRWEGRKCSVVGEGFFPIAGTLWSCPTTDHGRWIQGILLFVVLMLIWIWFNTVLIVDKREDDEDGVENDELPNGTADADEEVSSIGSYNGSVDPSDKDLPPFDEV